MDNQGRHPFSKQEQTNRKTDTDLPSHLSTNVFKKTNTIPPSLLPDPSRTQAHREQQMFPYMQKATDPPTHSHSLSGCTQTLKLSHYFQLLLDRS